MLRTSQVTEEMRLRLPPIRRTLQSFRGEWAVFRNRYTEGRDPFEWVPYETFRRFYWDRFLRTRLPVVVEFELNSHCNRRCSYCPVSIEPRPEGVFDEQAYQNLIDELAHLGYAGQIVPSFYGEPLLDRRIIRQIAYTRAKLPRAYVLMYTNADLLDADTFVTLIRQGVSLVRISQHDPEPSASIRRLQAFVKDHPEFRRHLRVVVYATSAGDRHLSSRGGLIRERRVQPYPRYGCFRSRRCTITFDGSLILCCEDYYAKYVYGNVVAEGFLNVWNKSLPQRREIFLGHYTTPICRVCVGLAPTQPQPIPNSSTAACAEQSGMAASQAAEKLGLG